MSEALLIQPSARELAHGESGDLSGRDRMTRNVLSSWAGHMVFVAAGFVMPRLIDQRIGQTGLGVWDFGWSLVNYFGLVQLGIGSSVNRYVAKYRALGDTEGLNRAVSSVQCLLLPAGAIVLALTIVTAIYLPALFGHRLGVYTADARWVLLFLGAALAVRISVTAFDGVITGFHRWELHNWINAGFYGATVLGMILVLYFGAGLRGLALVTLAGNVLSELTRVAAAYRICPTLRVRLSYAKWSQAKRMVNFGGKSFMASMSSLILYQTNSLLIVSYLGPGVLALFSRPLSLVRHIRTFTDKFAFVLTPMASSLDAAGQREQLRAFLIRSSRYAVHTALPAVLLLVIFGGPILSFWMGDRYERSVVLLILAIGHLTAMCHQPIANVLVGMNAHGRPGLAYLAGTILSVGMCVIMLNFMRWELVGVAVAITLPQTLVTGVYLPLCASRRLDMSVSKYLLRTWLRPVLAVVPFALCLTVIRIVWAGEPLVGLAYGLVGGGLVLGLTYWKYVLPEAWRVKIRRVLSGSVRFGWRGAYVRGRPAENRR